MFNKIILFLLILISQSLYSQEKPSDIEVNPDSKPYWKNDIYLSTGYGYPQGLKIDAGYTFGKLLRLGLVYCIYDKWSYNNDTPSMGIQAAIFAPFKDKRIAAYFLTGLGSKFKFFDKSDSYLLLNVGFIFNAIKWFNIKAEIGAFRESIYTVGKSRFNLSPNYQDSDYQVRFISNFQLCFELNIIEMFKVL